MLDRPTTTVTLKSKRNGVAADNVYDDHFPPAYVRIEVDANTAMTERFVMHELVHVTLSELILGKFDGTLEEVIILAFENFMWNFIESDPKRLMRWRRLVAKKIAETSPVIDVPIEKLVDRRKEDAAQAQQK